MIGLLVSQILDPNISLSLTFGGNKHIKILVTLESCFFFSMNFLEYMSPVNEVMHRRNKGVTDSCSELDPMSTV